MSELETRLRIFGAARNALRAYFESQGFLELTPPCLVPSNAPELHINPLFVSLLDGFASPEPRDVQLQTSPELWIKKVLAHTNIQKCYALTPVFRDGEGGEWHQPEFTMLEWYEPGDSTRLLAKRFYEILETLNDVVGREPLRDVQNLNYIDALTAVFPELDMKEYWNSNSPKDYIEGAIGKSLRWPKDVSHLEGIDLLWSAFVEPELNEKRLPLCVHNWLAEQASLAEIDPLSGFAKRVEGYLHGVELMNGFVELRDRDTQRERFQAVQAMRELKGQRRVAIDQEFIASLTTLPRCVGAALGFERALSTLCDAKSLMSERSLLVSSKP